MTPIIGWKCDICKKVFVDTPDHVENNFRVEISSNRKSIDTWLHTDACKECVEEIVEAINRVYEKRMVAHG